MFGEKAFEPGKVRVADGLVFRRLFGERMDQIDIEIAQEELTDERGLFPLGLTRGFGDLHRVDRALGFDFRH